MAIQRPEEQYILELINRARLDPAAEAARFGISLNEGPPSVVLTATAKQPLAMNDQIINAARAHSLDMINRDYFDHFTLGSGKSPSQRMTDAGYSPQVTSGENIAFTANTGPLSATQAVMDELHELLFVDAGVPQRGHRVGILNDAFKEVGNGVMTGPGYDPPPAGGGTFNVVMLTEDFGTRNASQRFLTGVAYNDTVANNDFYDMGEARAGVQVKVGAVLKATGGAAGGYSGDIGNAATNITFSGGGLVGNLIVAIGAGTTNIKLDVVDGNTIFSSTNITLVSGVTKAMLLGIANLTATGSAAANTLIGNRGNNTLNGAAGADTLQGAAGNDTYVVDNVGDKAIEAVNSGIDKVNSSVTFTLAVNVEHLTLTGAAAINGTGNTLANGITGNAAANVLNGAGGADTMTGGAGNDTYTVDNAGDKTIEALNGGTDRVNSSVTFTLAANVENLTLTGAAAIRGTGNTLANVITGNGAANVLNGLGGNDILNGGAGKDIIDGGVGNDIIVFNTALNAVTNVDTINGFVAANDTFRLENAIFAGLPTLGVLAVAAYREGAGSVALDATDRIIYNNTTGVLLYDADGNKAGGVAAIQFAKLAPGLMATLSQADFVVI